jgi:RNA polymerase sigma-70 factor (ECF subfamily)
MDEESLREMMKLNHTSAFGWALCCCHGDREEAAEVLHTAYVQVLEKGERSFSGKSSFKTWLFAVIRNTAKKRRYQISRRLLKLQSLVARIRVQDEEADGRYYRSQVREKILGLLRRLSPRQRQILQLVFYHNLTLEEAAVVMNVSLGSARTHYERGKARLKTEMRKAGWDHG